MDAAEMLGYPNILKALNEAFEVTKLEIFRPCEMLRSKL